MSSEFAGFILTIQTVELRGETYLELWILTDQGVVKATTGTQKVLFFIKQENVTFARSVLSQHHIPFDCQDVALTTFDEEPVAALYFTMPVHSYQAKEKLKQHQLMCFEDDVRLSERFLMERFVYGSAQVIGVLGEPNTSSGYVQLKQAKLKSGNYQPRFNVLSLDIECSEQGELFCIGLMSDTDKHVLMIGEPQASEPWIYWLKDEKAILIALVEHIQRLDPDIIIGWNVVNFDFRLLIKRAALHKVNLTLGRGKQPIVWRDARNEVNQGYVTMPGRVVIDGIDALKTATYQFASFSLESVAQALLGEGKEAEDLDNRLAQIEHDFQFNKLKLARYNLQDCALVLKIFAQTKVLDFLTLRSQLTGLELDRMGGSVAAFVNLYLPKLHRAGYVAPNRPIDGGLASPGGYVMSSRPGLYEHVLVLDFKSLYPSIIRTFKIDPLGLIEGLKAPDNAIGGYRGAVFDRTKHFLPDIITSLWQQRDQAKKDRDSVRSQAIKILMNSFYGVLGSGGCPFYDTRLASSITLRGHDIMQTTAHWIEQAGYQVIYGDTDSTFVYLQGIESDEQAQCIGQRLAHSINQQWTALIALEYQLENYLEIEFETHFVQFLMPTIRGSELGSKKRYAGLKRTSKGDELVFKGLETVRSDWTPLAKRFQLTLYQLVFAQQDVRQFLQQTIDDLKSGRVDKDLVYRKRIRRRLDLYVKNVPPHVKAARLADEQYLKRGKSARYQNKGWISYVITINGPEPVEFINSSLDYEHYIDKQIKPIAEGILPFIGLSFSELTTAQFDLFYDS
ncbi:DNA polymerase II [Flavobacterium sp. W21_SRS_FM6]|uniref:DNA polymerase II n=1 Tax=Flavobacterium sp. W21_SRS_FM6 TaxID=3240268 RepID=UPI003F92B593